MSVDSDKKAFIDELESMLESDDAYGSNVQILTYKPGSTITGRFKDSWNNRVFDFSVDETDGITYKPAVNLDSCANSEELISRFDSFSAGYTSGFVDNFDGKLSGKRTKKPKCGATAYGCGYSCIGVKKTCKIGVNGKKLGDNQGSNIGKERISKLMDLNKALYKDKPYDGKVSDVGQKLYDVMTERAKHTYEGKERLNTRKELRPKQEPKTEIAAELKPIAEVKKTRKPKAKKTTNKPPVEKEVTKKQTKNPNTHVIQTQKDFDNVMSVALDKVNKEGEHDGLVPIHELRSAIGELVPRDKFAEFMLGSKLIQNIGGEMTDNTPKKSENSIRSSTGSIRYYSKLTQQGEDYAAKTSPEDRKKAEKLLSNRPELDPLGTARKYTEGPKITSQKDFESTVGNVYNALNKEFGHEDLVPISRVRDVLKDRVPKSDFDKMLLESQSNDKYQLIGGGGETTEEMKAGGVKTKLGAERHYLQRKN